jgi:hypothetical protein
MIVRGLLGEDAFLSGIEVREGMFGRLGVENIFRPYHSFGLLRMGVLRKEEKKDSVCGFIYSSAVRTCVGRQLSLHTRGPRGFVPESAGGSHKCVE